MMRIFLALGLALFHASCASLQTVSVTPIPQERQKVVTAKTEKFIFLGFNFNNDFVDELDRDLKSQCTSGQIKGIVTKDEVISYFIAHNRRITATGFCVL